jgi:type II secretory pathway component GspD/PulD (secretin)
LPYTTAYRGNAGTSPAAAHDAAGAQAQRTPLRIAAGTKVLFVRGEQARIDQIKKLVQALDTDGDLQATEFGDARIIPVHTTIQGELTRILQQLQLPATTMELGKRHVVVLRGGDPDEISQAQEVIQALDQKPQPEDRKSGNQGGNGQPQQGNQGGQGGQGGTNPPA